MSSKVSSFARWVHLYLRRVLLVSGEAPWSVRIVEIKAKAAINLEAEHKAAQLSEELQSLVRQIRMRVCPLVIYCARLL